MKIITLDSVEYVDSAMEIELASFSLPWSRGVFEKEFVNDIAYYVGIEDNGHLIAYGGLWKVIDEGHITNIAVLPEYRHKGIGSQVLNALLEECEKSGICRATLEVRETNIAAQKLYTKMGFFVDGRRKAYYDDNKEDALIMWKTF